MVRHSAESTVGRFPTSMRHPHYYVHSSNVDNPILSSQITQYIMRDITVRNFNAVFF